MDDCWESNCEYINILTRRPQWYLIIIILNHGFHKDERKRQLNVLRNQHHFRKSDEELQTLRETLKKQRYHKKEMVERRNSESDKSEYR